MTANKAFRVGLALLAVALLFGAPAALAQVPVPGWTVAPSPPFGGFSSGLSGVSCTGLRSCTAVGIFGVHFRSFTVIEQWDGTTWTLVSSPNSDSFFSGLSGVSCTAATDCTAVGNSDITTLIERWDGTAWRIRSSPNPTGAVSSTLNAVSCPADTDCIAVGAYHLDEVRERALIERWDGTAWTIIPGPNRSGANTNSHLYGVSCTTPTTCSAVGTLGPGALIEQWNGAAWSIVASPDVGPAGLSAVSCTTPASCTAVGSNGRPLIEHSETADAGVRTLTVAVSGSQTLGSSSPTFATTTAAPAGDTLTGTLTCTTVGIPATTISSTLPAGTYPLNGSNCSGLALVGPTAANYEITYAGGSFIVTPGRGVTTTLPPTSTNIVPPLAFTGRSANIALSAAAGLIIVALCVIQLRRRSDS